MSLFDVIKYPISNPPTKAELETLPYDLLFNWKLQTTWKKLMPKGAEIDNLIQFYKFANSDDLAANICKGLALPELSSLRKMIKEYDDI